MDTQFATGIADDADGRTAGERAASEAFSGVAADRVDFCQAFCTSGYDYETVLSGIRDVVGDGAALIGCSSAGEFTQTDFTDPGVAVALVTSDSMSFHTGLGTGLSENVAGAVAGAQSSLPREFDGYDAVSAIVFHDGLSGVGERLTLVARRKLGPHVALAGGAASDGGDVGETTVFCGEEVATDAVGIALIGSHERPVISIEHGHTPESDPMEVTAADGNVVYELDGRPAQEAWRDAVSGTVLDTFGVDQETFEADPGIREWILGDTGFGIDQGDEYKTRWPRRGDEGAFVFATEIPEGTVLRVMCGQPDEQIDAARTAASRAVERAEGREMAGAFVYDCACRRTILGDRFGEAVAAIDETLGIPFAGFATFGEVAMEMGQTSGFHNTTTVVMCIPR
jgi:methyl-accepting chemotaxis protein